MTAGQRVIVRCRTEGIEQSVQAASFASNTARSSSANFQHWVLWLDGASAAQRTSSRIATVAPTGATAFQVFRTPAS